MKRINRELWAGAAGAAVAFLVVACGTTGGMSTTCSTDIDCGTGKMCHPTLKSCLTKCTGGSDCPSSSKTCASFSGAAYSADSGVAAFCQCSTDALCNASSAGQVCQGSIKICAAKCTSNTDCGGAACDTASGKCSGSVSDAGIPPAADAGVTCNSTNAEPDTCGYGNVCNASNGCDPINEGTCSNVTAAVAKTNHTLWTRASTGPVIYNVVPATAVQADCANQSDGGVPAAFTVTVYAYSTTDFPTNKSALPGFSYLTVSGNKTDIPLNLLRSENYQATGKNMSAKFTLCGEVGSTALQAAFAFTNGNAFCKNLSK